jgi:PIN domain nuclease of toxin-antitoxin system
VNYLIDTQLMVWAASERRKLSRKAIETLELEDNSLWVSVVSYWEVVLKSAARRGGIQLEVSPFRAGLLQNGYIELPIEARHIFPLAKLPWVHSDPFDRLLVSQAIAEGMVLLTADRALAEYGDPVRLV